MGEHHINHINIIQIYLYLNMSMLSEYFNLYNKYCKEYGEKTVLLYQVGAFFEVYTKVDKEGKDVTDENIIEYKKCTGLNQAYKTEDTQMLGFRDYMLDIYLHKILGADFTAVVYKQDKNEPNTTRSLHSIYSPGAYLQPDSVDGGGANVTTSSNNSMCIWMYHTGHMLVIGISTFDVISGSSYIYEAVIEGSSALGGGACGQGDTDTYTAKNKMLSCPTTYDELERYISTHNPSEVVIVSNLRSDQVNAIEKYINLSGRKVHRKRDGEDERVINATRQVYQKEVMQECFGSNVSEAIMNDAGTLQYSFGIQSFVYLLSFLSRHSPDIVSSLREPIFENNNRRMILANHSLKQLNIIGDGNHRGKMSCVSSFLNNCVTSMGRRLFKYNLLHPITDVKEIEDRYSMIDFMLQRDGKGFLIYEKLREIIINTIDLDRFHRMILINKVNPSTMYLLSQNLMELKDSILYLNELENVDPLQSFISDYLACSIRSVSLHFDMVDKDVFDLDNLRDICDTVYTSISSTLCLEKCKFLNNMDGETNIFREGVNKVLDEATVDLNRNWERLRAVQEFYNKLMHTKEKKKSSSKSKASKTTNVDEDIPVYVKIHETEKGGLSLQCTKRRGNLLEELLSKYPKNKEGEISIRYNDTSFLIPSHIVITSASASSSTTSAVITNETLHKLYISITNLRSTQKELILEEYKSYIDTFKTEDTRDKVNVISSFVANIDIMLNGAYMAEKYGYSRPTIEKRMNEEGQESVERVEGKSYVSYHEIRHPLIEHLNGDEIYVSNDISLGLHQVNGKEGEEDNIILLYGTNAVGKTSIIRAMGISLIMAQAGLFVPCKSMVYYPYTQLFTRIIGNDNLFKGLSTFAVEMSELRVILSKADSRSMVLGDELCSGTEHESAVSIFVSGLQELHEMNVSAIFATHLHEIVDFEEISKMKRLSMKHLTVRYDQSQDMLIYDRKLKDGPGNSMYGLEVCKSLYLPESFLQRAFDIREKYDKIRGSVENKVNVIMDSKTSRYNASKLVSICEVCRDAIASEVHHIVHQRTANDKGMVRDGQHHKNHTGNLVSICERCHKEMHSTENNEKVITKKKVSKAERRTKNSKSGASALLFS